MVGGEGCEGTADGSDITVLEEAFEVEVVVVSTSNTRPYPPSGPDKTRHCVCDGAGRAAEPVSDLLEAGIRIDEELHEDSSVRSEDRRARRVRHRCSERPQHRVGNGISIEIRVRGMQCCDDRRSSRSVVVGVIHQIVVELFDASVAMRQTVRMSMTASQGTHGHSISEMMVGPTLLLAVVVAHNLAAARTGRPTISTSIRWASRHPLGAWIAGGVIGGLLAHWFLGQETTSP